MVQKKATYKYKDKDGNYTELMFKTTAEQVLMGGNGATVAEKIAKLSNEYAPLSEFNKMKDQISKNKPIIITDDAPVGTVIWYSDLPEHIDSTQWKICDGRELKKSEYPDLFQVIKYRYGGSGENFKVPDLLHQRLFIRGTNSSGANVGTIEQDTNKTHGHEIRWDGEDGVSTSVRGKIASFGAASNYWSPNKDWRYAAFVGDKSSQFCSNAIGKISGPNTGTWLTATPDGGEENKPKNIAFIALIKAKSRSKDMVSIAQEVQQATNGFPNLKEAMNNKADCNSASIKTTKIGWFRIAQIPSDKSCNATFSLNCKQGTEHFTSVKFSVFLNVGYTAKIILDGSSHTNGGTISDVRVIHKGWNTSYLEVYVNKVNSELNYSVIGSNARLFNTVIDGSTPSGFNQTMVSIMNNNLEYGIVNNTNGWTIEGKKLEQWGYIEVKNPSSWTQVNLPVAYKNNNYNIQTTNYYTTNNYRDNYCGLVEPGHFSIGVIGGSGLIYWRTVGFI